MIYGIILSGMPCSGKSTIALKYAIQHDMQYISSGDIARAMSVYDNTTKVSLSKGELALESEMRRLISIYINKCIKSNISFILDGFPRFIEQDEWMLHNYSKIVKFIYVQIHIDKSECIRRANIRNRDDDNMINKRITYFEENTLPIFNTHKSITISNTFDIPDVVNKLTEELNNYISNSERNIR